MCLIVTINFSFTLTLSSFCFNFMWEKYTFKSEGLKYRISLLANSNDAKMTWQVVNFFLFSWNPESGILKSESWVNRCGKIRGDGIVYLVKSIVSHRGEARGTVFQHKESEQCIYIYGYSLCLIMQTLMDHWWTIGSSQNSFCWFLRSKEK